MNMELFFLARMDFFVGSTCEYLLMRQIIQRSQFQLAAISNVILTRNRILMASIRNLGDCPCPRCKIPLSTVHKIGTPQDKDDRRSKARIDDTTYRDNIDNARRLINDYGHLVNSADVERLLKPESLVPTSVRSLVLIFPNVTSPVCRMLFRRGSPTVVSTCIQCLWLTFYMR